MAYCQHNTQNVIQYVCKYMIGSKIDRYSVLDIMIYYHDQCDTTSTDTWRGGYYPHPALAPRNNIIKE